MLYGAVTGCAILPLVSAAQQGAVPYDAVYQLLGAAGINLVTNLVQQWKDRSDAEQSLPAELARLAAESAAARATGCATLLSKDLQSGRVVRGVTIVNPFGV